MTRLLFVRHGQSEGNAAGLWQGQWDPPLTDTGRAQARALAETVADAGIGLVASNDLQRAHETARILAASIDAPLRSLPGLREHDVGDWSAKPHDEIARRDPDGLARFRAGDATMRPGGGETRIEVRARVGAALASLVVDAPPVVAIVTHLGILRLLVPGIRMDNTGTLWLDAPDALRAAEGADAGAVVAASPAPGRGEEGPL